MRVMFDGLEVPDVRFVGKGDTSKKQSEAIVWNTRSFHFKASHQ